MRGTLARCRHFRLTDPGASEVKLSERYGVGTKGKPGGAPAASTKVSRPSSLLGHLWRAEESRRIAMHPSSGRGNNIECVGECRRVVLPPGIESAARVVVLSWCGPTSCGHYSPGSIAGRTVPG